MADIKEQLEALQDKLGNGQNMEGMAGLISQLAADEVNPENLKKQLLRHQTPLAFQISSIVELLKYQISIIPDHLRQPLAESVIAYFNSEVEKLYK